MYLATVEAARLLASAAPAATHGLCSQSHLNRSSERLPLLKLELMVGTSSRRLVIKLTVGYPAPYTTAEVLHAPSFSCPDESFVKALGAWMLRMDV